MWGINIIFDATTNTRWKSTIVKMPKMQICNFGQTQNLCYWNDIEVSSWKVKRRYSSNSDEELSVNIPFTWTQDRAKGVNIEKLPKLKFWIKKNQHATHLLKLTDNMCKYEMDLASIVEGTQRTRSSSQTDGRTDVRTDEQGETSIPNHFRWAGAITWN